MGAGRRRDPHPRRGAGRGGARRPGGGGRADCQGPRARGTPLRAARSISSNAGPDAAGAAHRVRPRGLRDDRGRDRGGARRARLRGGRPPARPSTRTPRAARGRARRAFPPGGRAGGRPSSSRTPTRCSSTCCARTGASTGPRPTCTTTRTAGAPGTRSSTTRSTLGTSAPPRARDRLVELNRTINWVPKHVRDGRFGNWLEHNVDWALSRERFWGTPLPVWTDGAGDFICIGSRAELEALCGHELGDVDLHRPAVDEDRVRPPGERPYLPAGAGGHRLLVRFGRDVLRPVALALREPGRVRGRLPRRLHLRGGRPDAGMVLHPACDFHPRLGQRGLPQLHLPRPHRRQGREEDVEVGRQHRRPVGRLRRGGRGPASLVPLGPHRPRGPEAGFHRPRARGRADLHQHLVEHLRLLRVVRAPRRGGRDGGRSARPPARDRPLDPLPPPAHHRDRDRGAWTTTTPRAQAERSRPSSTSSATGTCGATAGGSGRRRQERTSSPPTSPSTSASMRRTG